MAKMIYAGEDPAYVFRRMVIFAAEDVGMADPQALLVAQAAAAAYDRVGLPEGRFHLSEAAIYLATAPKSNSAMAFFDAIKTVEEERDSEAPVHLKSEARDHEGFGHGEGYLYPHAYRDHWIAQQYLPRTLQGRLFYHPGSIGYEKTIRDEVNRRREVQLAAMLDLADQPQEILSTSPAQHARDAWLARAASVHVGHLAAIRDRLCDGARVKRHHLALVLDGGNGLLVWELLRRVPEGGVWVTVRDAASAELLRMPDAFADGLSEPTILAGDLADLPSLLAAHGDQTIRFEAIVGRNSLALRPDKPRVLASIRAVTAAGGRLCLAETVPALSQRLSELMPAEALSRELREKLALAEQSVFGAAEGPPGTGSRTQWNEDGLLAMVAAAGYRVTDRDTAVSASQRMVREEDIGRWFARGAPGRSTYADMLAKRLVKGEIARVRDAVVQRLSGVAVPWKTTTLIAISEAV
jgi:putative ATPase